MYEGYGEEHNWTHICALWELLGPGQQCRDSGPKPAQHCAPGFFNFWFRLLFLKFD
jgi:hypothetical protein